MAIVNAGVNNLFIVAMLIVGINGVGNVDEISPNLFPIVSTSPKNGMYFTNNVAKINPTIDPGISFKIGTFFVIIGHRTIISILITPIINVGILIELKFSI